jgi:hypothetical protein
MATFNSIIHDADAGEAYFADVLRVRDHNKSGSQTGAQVVDFSDGTGALVLFYDHHVGSKPEVQSPSKSPSRRSARRSAASRADEKVQRENRPSKPDSEPPDAPKAQSRGKLADDPLAVATAAAAKVAELDAKMDKILKALASK